MQRRVPPQVDIFEDFDTSPAALWQRDAALHALDDLFMVARQYRASREFTDLLEFIGRFRWYSPFNAMLVHIQMSGATYVAPASRWKREYGRRVRAGQRPMVILKPMGPVMFVFDVSQTEAVAVGARDLPAAVLNPFKTSDNAVEQLDWTITNCIRDGIGVEFVEQGSQSAGEIQGVIPGGYLSFQTKAGPPPEYVSVPHLFDIQLNRTHSPATSYATLIHELAHVYCGHLGTPEPSWWPDRRGLRRKEREFEAESVSYLVCTRLGIETPAAEYLAGYLNHNKETPAISLDRVLTSAAVIEQMGRGRMKARKETASKT